MTFSARTRSDVSNGGEMRLCLWKGVTKSVGDLGFLLAGF